MHESAHGPQLVPETSQIIHHLRSFKPTPESIPPQRTAEKPLRFAFADGTPANYTALSPLHWIPRAAAIWPSKIATCTPDTLTPTVYTYAVWAQRVQNLAYAIKERGIGKGDRVCVLAPNSNLLFDAHSGVPASGAAVITPNVRLTKGEIEYIINHSLPSLILVDHEYAHLVSDTSVPTIICQDSGRSDCQYEMFLSSGRRYSKEAGWQGLVAVEDERQAACVNYTSGTTGRPKGVVTSHRSSFLAAMSSAYLHKLSDRTVCLWTLPMYHAAGWCYPWALVLAGATSVIIRQVRNDIVWNHLLHSGVTHFCCAPTVTLGILASRPPHIKRLPHPVLNIGGGASPTATMIARCEEIGLTYDLGYGMTETLALVVKPYLPVNADELTSEERAQVLAKQGSVMAVSEDVRVVYPEEDPVNNPMRDVPMDGKTIGEILFRGNSLMTEYLFDPEKTAEAFAGGWMHSGDLAVRYPTGEIHIQDRLKDMVISGGENVSTLAVESVMAQHPDIGEVAVVARAHPKWGERPMAFIVLNQQARTTWKKDDLPKLDKAIKDFSRKSLAGYAVPEWIEFVDDLPKSSTGKVLKAELRKMASKFSLSEPVLAKL